MTRDELNAMLDELMFDKVPNDYFSGKMQITYTDEQEFIPIVYEINNYKFYVGGLDEDYQADYGISRDDTAFLVCTDETDYIVTWASREVLDLNTGDWWVY